MSTYSKPLYDNRGELFAVFIASISLTQFTDTISLLKPYPSSYTYLISRNGSFLTHADRDKIMNETIFSEAFATENHSQEQIGREMLAGHTGTIRFDNQEMIHTHSILLFPKSVGQYARYVRAVLFFRSWTILPENHLYFSGRYTDTTTYCIQYYPAFSPSIREILGIRS